jgi:hypothetical protein
MGEEVVANCRRISQDFSPGGELMKRPAKPKRKRTSRKSTLLAPELRTVLHQALQDGRLVLFLGAGVSLEYGLPPWRSLVLDLLFEHVADGSPLRQLAINYRRAVSDWLADYLAYGPTVLSRLIEDVVHARAYVSASDQAAARAQFLKVIQSSLYEEVRVPKGRTTLQAIARLIASKPDRMPAIITFNFDDLLEQELKRQNILHQPVYSFERPKHGLVPVIHAHGYIPQRGEPPAANIVFTERDYHALTEGVFHWALTEVVWHLRHHTVLFVGLSMSDPNLRRLLDAALTPGQPPHYQLQKRHQVLPENKDTVLKQLESSARQWRRKFRRGIEKGSNQLFGVLETSLHQADDFDTQLFGKMGVNTIWLNDYKQIPKMLDEITEGP